MRVRGEVIRPAGVRRRWLMVALTTLVGPSPAPADSSGDEPDQGSSRNAVHVDQPLHRDRPEPDEERDLRIRAEMRQALQRVDVGFLQDVGRRDPTAQPRVEPQRDDPPEAVPMEREQHGEAPTARGR